MRTHKHNPQKNWLTLQLFDYFTSRFASLWPNWGTSAAGLWNDRPKSPSKRCQEYTEVLLIWQAHKWYLPLSQNWTCWKIFDLPRLKYYTLPWLEAWYRTWMLPHRFFLGFPCPSFPHVSPLFRKGWWISPGSARRCWDLREETVHQTEKLLWKTIDQLWRWEEILIWRRMFHCLVLVIPFLWHLPKMGWIRGGWVKTRRMNSPFLKIDIMELYVLW